MTRITGILHEDRYTFLIISRSVLLRMLHVSDKSCTENQSTHFVLSNFFRKSCRLSDNVELLLFLFVSRLHTVYFYFIMWKKYCTSGQATDDNMAHAHCMLDT
jgi:hypothetical protein